MSFAAVAGPHSGRATPSLREAPQQQPMSTTGRGSTYRRRNAVQTNPATSLIRNPQGRIANRIREVGEPQVCTSIIVAAELRYGAANKGSIRLARQVEA